MTTVIQLTFAVHINRTEVKRFVYPFNGSEISGHPITKRLVCPSYLLLENRDDTKTLVTSITPRHGHFVNGMAYSQIIESLKKDGSFETSYGHQISRDVILDRCDRVRVRTFSRGESSNKRDFVSLETLCCAGKRPIHLCFLEYIFILLFLSTIASNTYAAVMYFNFDGRRERQTIGAESGTISEKPCQGIINSGASDKSSTPTLI